MVDLGSDAPIAELLGAAASDIAFGSTAEIASGCAAAHVRVAWQAAYITAEQWSELGAPLGLQAAIRRRIEPFQGQNQASEEEERKRLLAKHSMKHPPVLGSSARAFVCFWDYAFVHLGYSETHSRLVDYYNNLGMIAALMAGVSAVFADMNVDIDTHPVCRFFAELGFLGSQIGFVSAVIESSLAANTLQHIFQEEDFLKFTGQQGMFLSFPTKFLISAMFFASTQFIAVAVGTFTFTMNKLLAMVVTAGASVLFLRRCNMLEAHLNRNAAGFFNTRASSGAPADGAGAAVQHAAEVLALKGEGPGKQAKKKRR